LRISGIVWLEEIVDKLLQKHNVTTTEVREVFQNCRHFRFIEKGHRRDENVYSALGRTEEGRYLAVFFVRKKDHQALILSAREMTGAERSRYEKK
jgi:uncharacterized protein